MPFRWIVSLFAFIAFFAATAAPAADAPARKIKALIITGADPAHAWKDNAKCVQEILVESGRFESTIVENYAIFEKPEELATYDVVVLIGAFQNKKGFELSDKAKETLTDFVKAGKGIFVQHLASSSWETWDEFGVMLGKRWVNGKSGHGRRVPFEATVNAGHPITKGLKNFTTDDELYGRFGGTGNVKALVTGFSPDFSKAVEPLVFVNEYGKGRAVVNNLGHDRKAMKTTETRTIIARGIEWAATGNVAESK